MKAIFNDWKTWSLVAYILAITSFYEFGYHTLSEEKNTLEKKLQVLEDKKQQGENQKEQLTLELNSLNDPMWVELVLIRDLGVLPKDKKKIVRP
jgi:hypothetical protein